MTEFADRTLETLCAEATSRLDASNQDLAQDIVLIAEAAHNQLQIPRTSADGWAVYCVGSRLLRSEFKQDTVHLEDGSVRHVREYAPITAEAYYAALREEPVEKQNNAALYAVRASVQLPNTEASRPFREVAAEAVSGRPGMNPREYDRQRLEGEQAPGNIFKPRNPEILRVLGVPGETELTFKKRGINSLDYPRRPKVGLEVAMTGPARLVVPPEQFLRVEAKSVEKWPKGNAVIPVTLAPELPRAVCQLTVLEGEEVQVLQHGQIGVPGSEEDTTVDTYTRYYHNPRLSHEEALALLGREPGLDELDWQDVTHDLFEKLRWDFLNACPIDPDEQAARAFALAREALAEAREKQAVQPSALGYLAVGKHVGEITKNFGRDSLTAVAF